MSQPTPYTHSTDFSQQEAINASGRSTVNTSSLDAELANIETTLDQTLANMALLQRDDGRLKDLACELHTLSPEVLNLMGGFNLRGLWQAETLYSVKDIVSNTEYTYLCQTTHTAGAAFDEQYWVQFGFSGGADAAQAAAAAQVSANNADASALAAAASALAASGSAATATTQAGNAADSAEIAATEAGNSATSATNSSNSAAAAEAAAENLPNATTAGANKFLKTNTVGTAWEYQTALQARASLGLAIGTDVQAYSAVLGGISAGSTGTSFKNLLINSPFQINNGNAGVPYVSGATLPAGQTGHECWKAGASGGDYIFIQNAAITGITIASGKSLIQVIEAKFVRGGTYILHWIGTAKCRAGINSATPSGTYVTSPLVITGQSVGVTMSIEVTNDGTGGTFSEPQLERGSIASAHEFGADELRRTQRHHIRMRFAQYDRLPAGWNDSSTSCWVTLQLPTTMASSTPSVDVGTNLTSNGIGLTGLASGPTLTGNSLSLHFSSSGLTQGAAQIYASAAETLTISARL